MEQESVYRSIKNATAQGMEHSELRNKDPSISKDCCGYLSQEGTKQKEKTTANSPPLRHHVYGTWHSSSVKLPWITASEVVAQ